MTTYKGVVDEERQSNCFGYQLRLGPRTFGGMRIIFILGWYKDLGVHDHAVYGHATT